MYFSMLFHILLTFFVLHQQHRQKAPTLFLKFFYVHNAAFFKSLKSWWGKKLNVADIEILNPHQKYILKTLILSPYSISNTY